MENRLKSGLLTHSHWSYWQQQRFHGNSPGLQSCGGRRLGLIEVDELRAFDGFCFLNGGSVECFSFESLLNEFEWFWLHCSYVLRMFEICSVMVV